jgi:SAM-dependent methyltransferase
MGAYSGSFFRRMNPGSRESAEVVVPLVIGTVGPASVVDFGCGQGAWLAAFLSHGVGRVLGLDGDYVERSRLLIPADSYRAVDLSRPFSLEERFDLAMSLEVAEHLPADAAAGLVDALVGASDLVLFSAAVPGQGGIGHLNEQWQSHWAARFAERGYSAIDCIRPKVWGDARVKWWYAQNCLLYASRRALDSSPALQALRARSVDMPLDVIHPRWSPDGELPADASIRRLVRQLWAAILGRCRGTP